MENMEELTGLLIEFYERFSSWEQGVVRETGLTLPQMHTLEIIGATGNLRMKEVAEKMGVTTGSLTVLVDRLVRAGLVERKPDEKDRRSIRVGLTPEGRKHFEGHHLLHLQLSQDIAGALTPEEAERFPQMLTKIMAQF
ncbi:MarR family transcriptional regulator [Desulfovibrio sulfodismutans]|uniref:MarR family transcriptional regulator n=1 Tax=Desulfolutivibrio sulfodismutans TaxID=63561 RepID=A0A7K3NQ19_9BACT|nr:MarR family transcriptional regulator [Desulfolutivibrio sulfodismutans]NDY57913.1 MarR family transcriptional regulator [Desulfolutivibrio sulfodismutans]QLA14038.1 MarR family transcriptional regulator [Desulfolutivibrio sulfodismutans DSM 3696]